MSFLKFHATDDQIKDLVCNLYNASSAVGIGLLHYDPEPLTPDKVQVTDRMNLDYVQGRQVKVYFQRIKGCEWVTRDRKPHPDYNTWISKYSSIKEALIDSNITKIKEVESLD